MNKEQIDDIIRAYFNARIAVMDAKLMVKSMKIITR